MKYRLHPVTINCVGITGSLDLTKKQPSFTHKIMYHPARNLYKIWMDRYPRDLGAAGLCISIYYNVLQYMYRECSACAVQST